MKRGIKNQKRMWIIIAVVAAIVLISTIITIILIAKKKDVKQEPKKVKTKQEKIEIFNGDERPIGIMIDNVGRDAWPQVGLQDAYCVYEILVEAGISRFIAFFKGQETQEIGPVRSSRPYFLDYVLEHDAIYGHFGGSIQALGDIPALNINNINGISFDGSTYWRSKRLSAPHNAFTSMKNLKEQIIAQNYRDTSDRQVFNYSAKEINLDKDNEAKNIKIKYSSTHNLSYEYDEDEKVYKRTMRGVPHIDYLTQKQYTAKNIIVQYVEKSLLNDPREASGAGHIKLSNIGSGEGFFITNGNYEKIKWQKDSRESKTKYLNLEGEEIVLNDGNVYVQIIPLDGEVDFN